MRGLGTIVNVATVLAGAFIGVVGGRFVPERVRETVMAAVGLLVLALGVDNALATDNFVFPLVALVVGAAIGEALSLEERLASIGRRLQGRRQAGSFVEGFVAASLVFSVGPLTILGSISDGLGRGAEELFVKAALDGLVALVFASTMGIGVAFSAVTVLVVQGGLTLFAGVLEDALSVRMIDEMTATGGVMLLGIGVRLLGIKEVRVASMLPGLIVAPVLVSLFGR